MISPESSKASLRLKCPVCARPVAAVEDAKLAESPVCLACGFVFERRDGIWNALSPLREEQLQKFVAGHPTIGSYESRGVACAHYYLGLPYKDATGWNPRQWKIRGRSFRFFDRKILPVLEQRYPQGMDILDIGAGNCWMSYRLALREHRPVAVDLCVRDATGLGAGQRYFSYLPQSFPRFQAEMNRLPFDDSQFDAAIFNASFHYSEDYDRTLREALRCLRRPGHIFIIDSPVYWKDEGAPQAVEEDQAESGSLGFNSDSISSRGYLTPGILDELASRYHLAWRRFNPWHGIGWALRPVKAHLLRRPETSKLFIFWATADVK